MGSTQSARNADFIALGPLYAGHILIGVTIVPFGKLRRTTLHNGVDHDPFFAGLRIMLNLQGRLALDGKRGSYQVERGKEMQPQLMPGRERLDSLRPDRSGSPEEA